VKVHSMPHPFFLCFSYVLLTVPISSTHAPTCWTRKMHRVCVLFLFAAYLPPLNQYHSLMEVFAVPRRFRSEPVGTSWILVGNFGVEGLPNKQETTLTFSNRIPIGSTGSESEQFLTGSNRFQLVPTGSKWIHSERLRLVSRYTN